MASESEAPRYLAFEGCVYERQTHWTGSPSAVPVVRELDVQTERPCACRLACGDVAENDDDPRAECKRLPRGPR